VYKRNIKGWAKHLDFIILDLICLAIAYVLAYEFRFGLSYVFAEQIYSKLFWVILAMDFVSILILDTMKNVIKRGLYKEFVVSVCQALVILLGISTYLFSTQVGEAYSRMFIYLVAILYGLISYLSRVFWKKHILKHLNDVKNKALIIMASEELAAGLVDDIINNNYGHHNIVGLVIEEDNKVGQSIKDIPVVAACDDIVEYVTKNWVDEVLIALNSKGKFPIEVIDELNMMGVTVHLSMANVKSSQGVKQSVGNVGGMMVVSSSLNYMTPRQYYAKRTMDIIGGLLGCIITGILYLILAPLIKSQSPGPTFFVQQRIGRNGKPFRFYKFRSMYMDAEERKAELLSQNRLDNNLMFKMDFDPRVIGNRIDADGKQKTGIGEFIRKYSLDEFPQFFNVLKGDMSLVGTRPLLYDEYMEYSAHHKARLAATPGITGLWQVSGRSDILDFDEVVRLDTEYINNWSIGMDIKILLKTIKVVLKKEGSM